MSIVNLDQRAGVVKPQTMPDTLPQVGYHRSVPSMIIYNPLTTRMTTTHNPRPCLNMWKRRGGGYCVQRYNGGVPRDDWEAGHAAMCVKSCRTSQVLYGGKRVNLRAGIAQRVGTGLRPGKLSLKTLGEDNKDSELARGIDQVINFNP